MSVSDTYLKKLELLFLATDMISSCSSMITMGSDQNKVAMRIPLGTDAMTKLIVTNPPPDNVGIFRTSTISTLLFNLTLVFLPPPY